MLTGPIPPGQTIHPDSSRWLLDLKAVIHYLAKTKLQLNSLHSRPELHRVCVQLCLERRTLMNKQLSRSECVCGQRWCDFKGGKMSESQK